MDVGSSSVMVCLDSNFKELGIIARGSCLYGCCSKESLCMEKLKSFVVGERVMARRIGLSNKAMSIIPVQQVVYCKLGQWHGLGCFICGVGRCLKKISRILCNFM